MGTRKFRTPAAERQSALQAATQLMAERAKYETWIEELEAKKASTPAKVFDRVRQDYLSRLQGVMEQLGEYTSTLRDHAETLEAKLEELQAAEETNTEELAEAALRKQVGEMSNAEFDTVSKKSQRELAKIKENQEVISLELTQIRDLLDAQEEGEEGAEEAASPKQKGAGDFNELEFLSKVVGVATDETAAPAAPPAPAKSSAPASQPVRTPPASVPPAPAATSQPPAAAAAALAVPPAGSASAARAGAPPAAAPPRVSAPSPVAPRVSAPSPATNTPASGTAAAPPQPSPPKPEAPAPAAVAASPAEPAPAPAAPVAAPNPAGIVKEAELEVRKPASETGKTPKVTADSPTQLKPGQQAKTLQCTECKAMNYASEWYCERCGAELTVV